MATALEGGEGSASRPGRSLPPGKTRYPLYRRAGWAPGPVWPGVENLAPTGIRSPDRPARSQSLYRLRYTAHTYQYRSYRNCYSRSVNLRTGKHYVFFFAYKISERAQKPNNADHMKDVSCGHPLYLTLKAPLVFRQASQLNTGTVSLYQCSTPAFETNSPPRPKSTSPCTINIATAISATEMANVATVIRYVTTVTVMTIETANVSDVTHSKTRHM